MNRPATSGTSPLLRAVCLAAVVLSLVVYGLSLFQRYLVNDDYQILHTAWLRASGQAPGRDFAIYSYHLIVDLLVPVFRWFPDSFVPLFVARAAMWMALCAIAWMLYRLAAIWFDPVTACITPVLALSAQAMIHRALDIRPDLLTTLLWLLILLILSSPFLVSPGRLVLLGATIAAVIINRFKAALIAPLVVLVLAEHVLLAVRQIGRGNTAVLMSGLRVAGLLLAGFVAPCLAYISWLAAHGELHTFYVTNVALAGVVGGAHGATKSEAARTLAVSLDQDAPFWLLAALGVVLRAANAKRFSGRLNVLAGGLALVLLGSVVLNPAYYPYNLVTLVPLLAPFAAYPIGLLAAGNAGGTRGATAALLLIASPFVSGGSTMLDYATRSTNAHQRALEQFLLRYTPDTATVFALEGIGIYRPSLYHWRMPWVIRPAYVSGQIDFSREMAESPPVIVVTSYRLPGWLLPRDRDFVARHYVPLAPYLLTQGFARTAGASAPSEFELLSPGRYELVAPSGVSCQVDARPVAPGATIDLTAGRHTLEGPPQATCTVRRYFSAEARAMVANPLHRPYLVPPNLASIE